MIYFDNAATSYYKPPEVTMAVFDAMGGMGSSGRGANSVSMEASRLVYDARVIIDRMFHVGSPSRVIFTQNATDSLNIAIQGLLHSGDHVITTAIEHNSVLRPLYIMEERGIVISKVFPKEDGKVDSRDIIDAIKDDTRAVVLSHGSNVTGNVIDIKTIGNECEKRNILFIVDGSQTAGLLPISMEEFHISALCFSGHKGLLGPQGVGVLCLKDGVQPPSYKAGGTGMDSFSKKMPEHLPEALETGTLNVHGIVGLHAACQYIERYGMDEILNRANDLAHSFVKGIESLPGIRLYGSYNEKSRIPVVAFNIRDEDSARVAVELDERYEIAIRAGAHCAPGIHQFFKTINQGMVRFSFSHFNTREQVQIAIDAIRTLEEE